MDSQRIRATDVARAAARVLPDFPRMLRGALAMSWMGADSAQSIGLLLEQRAREMPHKVALLFEGESWSYRELNAHANRIASVLRECGVRRGDAVGILFENRPAVLACVAAVVKLGAVTGMLNPNQRNDALQHSLNIIAARVIIVGEECVTALEGALPRKKTALTLLWEGEGTAPPRMKNLRTLLRGRSAAAPRAVREVRLGDPCFFIFTSGTTGLPKAAVMTHLRWMRSAWGMGQTAMRLRAEDVLYCPLPFYHNNALTLAWGAVLVAGASLAMAPRFSATRFWSDIRSTRATAFVYIGELCRYLLNRPPDPADRDHAVRVVIGNGLRAEIWDTFQQRFGIRHICEFYGSSEGNLVFVNALGLPRTAGFCPLPYAIVAFDAEAELPLRNARGFMRRVAPGEAGLLLMKVSELTPFDGYTDSAASEARLLHDVFRGGDTWFDSGDLVRELGFRHIAFVDRVGDTFRWKGENVASTEVERVLGQRPGVVQACVYGVQVPHADGRAGMAALVLDRPDAFAPGPCARALQKQLPPYAVPRFLRIVPEHETTATFKIRKVDLKRQGFDPRAIDDPLWVLLDRNRGYQPLTADIFTRISSGRLRLP
ncbi:MAG: long-chain-acyl-CoA synthetase [Gammaproteobacteria bacterium]|nr:long-chain-acyl-CoA synthetase [Gammaproteobacteria bacterium]